MIVRHKWQTVRDSFTRPNLVFLKSFAGAKVAKKRPRLIQSAFSDMPGRTLGAFCLSGRGNLLLLGHLETKNLHLSEKPSLPPPSSLLRKSKHLHLSRSGKMYGVLINWHLVWPLETGKVTPLKDTVPLFTTLPP